MRLLITLYLVVFLQDTFALQSGEWASSATTPGSLRRRLIRVPKLALPLPLISAVVASLKAENPIQAFPIFFETLRTEQRKNTALPVAHKPFEQLSFCEDSLSAQCQARSSTPPPFLLQLTPSACHLDPQDHEGQIRWLQENAVKLKHWKISHGAIYFRSWSLFSDAPGVSQAVTALGLTPCRDPKEVRGPAPLLTGSSTIYETLNNPEDAATHLGLHYEGIPGVMPVSALFSCFQAAETGGEFLLCDGRGVIRDLESQTLANLHSKRLRPTFAVLPDWLAKSPCSFIPFATALHRELLALVTDMTAPTDDFFLDVFPEANNGVSLKLTTHAAPPVLHHPVTNEPVWFSGMDAGHQGNFQRNNPDIVGGQYASEVFDVRYGDGTEISDVDLQHVREACEANTVELALQPGDAVYLDNFTVLHGRKPFTGTRKHTVVWCLD